MYTDRFLDEKCSHMAFFWGQVLYLNELIGFVNIYPNFKLMSYFAISFNVYTSIVN